jgi:hypothetical protein
MVRKFFIFTLLYFTSAFCTPSVTLDLSEVRFLKDKSGKIRPTVFLGETFTLQITTVGGRENVRVEGLEQFSTQGKSQSSSISVDNSKMLIEQTIDYKLIPKKEGSFIIGPATTRIDGKTIESNKVIVHVQRRTEKIKSDKPVETDSGKVISKPYKIICELTLDKKNVFVEEPLVVTMSLYHRGSGYNIRGIVPPQFPNCTVKEDEKVKQFKRYKNGETYSVIQKNFIVFPGKPGILNISPAKAVYTTRVSQPKRRLGFFDDNFFSNFFSNQTQQKIAPSNSLSITVEKLPTETTQKEAQGIGTFSRFSARCNKLTADINEPVSLTLELEGSANFDLILPPKLSLPDIFKSYDSKTEFVPGKYPSHGTKRFSFILQIPEQGTWTIPKQIFSYFDTKENKFKTLKTSPITLMIKLPHGYTAAPEKETPTPPVAKITDLLHRQKDIHFIEESAPATRKKPFSIPLGFLIIITLLIPGIFYASVILDPLKNKFLNKQKNIFDTSTKNIIDAIEFNEFEKFYSIFVNFIAKRTNIPQHKVTHEKIIKLLSGTSRVEQFSEFLKECAQYSFASTKLPRNDVEKLKQEALDWLKFLNKNI